MKAAGLPAQGLRSGLLVVGFDGHGLMRSVHLLIVWWDVESDCQPSR
jgi:hypothetical protein